MLNKYGQFRYAICTFQGVIFHHKHKNRNIGGQGFKYSKRSTQIQNNSKWEAKSDGRDNYKFT